MKSEKVFPVGLIIIWVVSICLFYMFPKIIFYIFTACVIVSGVFLGIIIYRSENAPESDQDFDVKFRKEDAE